MPPVPKGTNTRSPWVPFRDDYVCSSLRFRQAPSTDVREVFALLPFAPTDPGHALSLFIALYDERQYGQSSLVPLLPGATAIIVLTVGIVMHEEGGRGASVRR